MANPEIDNYVKPDYGKIITYEHHGTIVSVREELKGLHRELCLCYDCASFKPGVPEENCKRANLVYAICIAEDMTTPVTECSMFKIKVEHPEHCICEKCLPERHKYCICEKCLPEKTEQPKEFGTPDLCETAKSIAEHKSTCAFVLASEAGKTSSEVIQCDCGAIVRCADNKAVEDMTTKELIEQIDIRTTKCSHPVNESCTKCAPEFQGGGG